MFRIVHSLAKNCLEFCDERFMVRMSKILAQKGKIGEGKKEFWGEQGSEKGWLLLKTGPGVFSPDLKMTASHHYK